MKDLKIPEDESQAAEFTVHVAKTEEYNNSVVFF